MSVKLKIIVAVIITTLIVGVGVYYFQENRLAKSPQVINVNTSQNNTESTSAMGASKTFQGNGFSFVYPEKYSSDDKGLWTKEDFAGRFNTDCSTCNIPYIEIDSATTQKTLDQYIISSNGLSESANTLDEMSKQTKIPYERIKTGDNYFIKITVNDLYGVTSYYTKNRDMVIAFKVYFAERDNAELREIISTLKFN